ncbi:hypothetical protein L6452_06474 [Arctium lappa]|uniref:Uncharacterized protein n=1 Tax=Arctium lappa TaxID=4217 RepID=A0ACB9EJP6_ARCLA|nr:hypothetical protein L6452_06474 [Arctium lappa]
MTIGNDVCKFKDYMIIDMGLNFTTVVYLDFGNWYYNFLLPHILDNCTTAGLFGFWHQLLFKVFSWDRRNKEGHMLLEFDLDIPMTYGQIGPFLTYVGFFGDDELELVALLYLNDWADYYHVMVGCGDDAIDATNSRMVEFIVGLSLENFILGRYLKNFNAIEESNMDGLCCEIRVVFSNGFGFLSIRMHCSKKKRKNNDSSPIRIDFETEAKDAPPENDMEIDESPHHNPGIGNVVEEIINHPEEPMPKVEPRFHEHQASNQGSCISYFDA